jgi:hypothetical protein
MKEKDVLQSMKQIEVPATPKGNILIIGFVEKLDF